MARLPKLRGRTWVIIVIVVLDVLWMVAMGSALDSCNKELGNLLSGLGYCQLNLTPFLIVNALVIGSLVAWQLSLRACPVCGTKASRGVTVCKKCGYDFTQAAAAAVQHAPQQPAPQKQAPQQTQPPMPTVVQPAGTADEIQWLTRGERYLLGRTLTSPYYGIWDKAAPGPPMYKYPYTEHGKSEAEGHFASLEPALTSLAETPHVDPGNA
jgi:hypothetical protein